MADPSLVGRRVWIVNHYADAPDRPTGTRHYDLGRRLAARGADVVIFASGFSNVTQRDDRLRGNRLSRIQRCDGVRFVWLRTFPYRGSTWRRQVNMLSFLAAFLVAQRRHPRPDVVIGSTVHPFAALGAWLASRLRRTPFVFEVRDLWPQTLVDLGALREGSPGERLLRALEAHLVRRASAVITLLPGMRAYLLERGLPADRVVYIPNGVDLAACDGDAGGGAPYPDAVAGVLAAIDALRGAGRFVLGYVGSFGRVNRLDVVIDAAALAEQAAPGRIGIVLVGDGPERDVLQQRAGLGASVVVASAVPKRWVPTVLRALDGALIHATRTPVYRYGISFNKLYDYMAASLPILFACDTAFDVVAAERAGITVPPDDPVQLAAAALELADTTADARAAMGASGRRYVERTHDVDALGALLAEVIARPDGDLPATAAPPGLVKGGPDASPAPARQ